MSDDKLRIVREETIVDAETVLLLPHLERKVPGRHGETFQAAPTAQRKDTA